MDARQIILPIFLFILPVFSWAQGFEDVQIEPVKVSDNIYMLVGRGGNIGVCIGEDGVLMVDSQFEQLAEKVKQTIADLNDGNGDVRFLVNTHLHGDHIGGNPPVAQNGGVIVAHDNVRKRITTEQVQEYRDRTVPPAPEAAWPIITFGEDITFHLNGEEILVSHGPQAHTDGDVVVYFKNSNGIHTGDVFYRFGFPFIDEASGGSVNGFVAHLDKILNMIDENTKIIPGHGEVASKADLQAFRDGVADLRDKFMALVNEGKSLDEILAANITEGYDDWDGGFIKAQDFVNLMHYSLKNEGN